MAQSVLELVKRKRKGKKNKWAENNGENRIYFFWLCKENEKKPMRKLLFFIWFLNKIIIIIIKFVLSKYVYKICFQY